MGSREEGQLCHCFCKTVIKGHIWQSEKELWGNLCWEMRSKRGNKGSGGTAGLLFPGMKQWTELEPGTNWQWEHHWQLLLGIPMGWGHVFCRVVQRVTVLALDRFYLGAQQLIMRHKMKREDHLSRFLCARCSTGTGQNRLPNMASFTWFSSSC